MKRAKTAIPFLLVFILLCSFISVTSLSNTQKTCDMHISAITSAAEKEDFAVCREKLMQLQEYWTSRKPIYLFFVHREMIESVDSTLREAFLFCEKTDKYGVSESMNIIKATLSRIAESELPLIENIV